MNEERRKGPRFATPIIGLLRNVARQSHPEEARLKNLSEGGLLLESWQKWGLRDTIEFRFKGHTFLGEVAHYGRNREKWLAGVRFEHRLEEEQLRRILEPQRSALSSQLSALISQLSALSYKARARLTIQIIVPDWNTNSWAT
jgi:hypothetical protein